MLKIIFNLLISLGTFLCALNCFGQGSVVGNGGDGIAIEFRILARVISENLRSMPISPGFDVEAFAVLVESAIVQTEDQLFLADVEVDAINYPALKKIVISRKRWPSTNRSVSSSVVLVFHELLGLMGIHDDLIVKKYSNTYIENFINAVGESRPRLLSRCDLSLKSSDVAKFGSAEWPMGAKNLLLYRQNSDFLIYYQDNMIPVSTRPDETKSYFLGYFKCHMNPLRTDVVCTDTPCSRITMNLNAKAQAFMVHIAVDRITESCRLPQVEPDSTMTNYLRADLAFPLNRCQLFGEKTLSAQ